MKKYTFEEFKKHEFNILIDQRNPIEYESLIKILKELNITWVVSEELDMLDQFIISKNNYLSLIYTDNNTIGYRTDLDFITPLVLVSQLGWKEDNIEHNNFIGQCIKSSDDLLYEIGQLYYFNDGVITLGGGKKSVRYQSIEDFNKKSLNCKMVEIKEVKRSARVGEYIKVVDPQEIPKTNGVLDYDKGSILKILKVKDEQCYYSAKYNGFLYDDEYVVLEGYQDLGEGEIEVGDMVEVVYDGNCILSDCEWFKETDNLVYKSHYVRFKRPCKNKQYKVVSHHGGDSRLCEVYCIQDLDTTQVFLMTKDGIKKILK